MTLFNCACREEYDLEFIAESCVDCSRPYCAACQQEDCDDCDEREEL